MSSDQPTRWSLADLYSSPEDPAVQRAFADLNRKAAAFEKNRKRLSPRMTAKAFRQIILDLEAIQTLARGLSAYAQLHFCEDTQDSKAMAFLADIEQRMADLENRVLFFTLWWKGLPAAAAERLMAGSGEHRYFLEQMRRFSPFTLTEPEEKIINLKNATGSQALANLYQTIVNRYQFKLEWRGETKQLTYGELTVHVRAPEAGLREAAYRSLYDVYSREGPVLGQIYSTLLRDWRNENLQLRGFSSPIAVRNLSNDLPDRTVRLLLDVCRANAPLFQRYFALKARRLGMPRLRRYDIYAPLAPAEKQYSFGQAWDHVRSSFEAFDPAVAALAGRVLEQNHIDAEVRKGKREGAFCLSALPALTPWVLTNYQGRAYDVSTLAHELGHAVHAMLAAGRPLFTFDAALPLAETASTFSEMLLADYFLGVESDAAVRRDMLFRQMDDSYATICRQAFFAMFEIEAHDAVRKGATVEDLCGLYRKNLENQFGDSVEVGDEFRWEWVVIPHFYESPFYVYAYAFGQLLVLALYGQYRAEGRDFIPRYKKILSSGGSASPAKILRAAGIRIDRPEFWQGGFDLLKQNLDRLEQI